MPHQAKPKGARQLRRAPRLRGGTIARTPFVSTVAGRADGPARRLAGGGPLRFSPAPSEGLDWAPGGARRGAGVVERGGLENRCTLAGTVGSNPTSYFNLSSTFSIDNFPNERSTRPICKHFANITLLEAGLNVRFPPKSGRVTCRGSKSAYSHKRTRAFTEGSGALG